MKRDMDYKTFFQQIALIAEKWPVDSNLWVVNGSIEGYAEMLSSTVEAGNKGEPVSIRGERSHHALVRAN